MTWRRVLAARCARALPETCYPPESEGAGNTGCTLHPRSRVQIVRKKTHTSIQVQRRHSGIPCAMALRLMARSPRRIGLCCLRRLRIWSCPPGWARKTSADLTPTSEASGPHDFAVRFSAVRLRAVFRSQAKARPANNCMPTLPRPPHPVPTFVTWPTPLSRGRDGESLVRFEFRINRNIFAKGTEHPKSD